MVGAEKRETCRLSFNQKNIWDLEQLYGGCSINNISTTLHIQGRLDFTLLQQAIDAVISKDPTLRTRLILEEGEPVQYSASYVQELFPVYDFSGTEESGVEVWEQTLAREALPLLESPLYRFVLFRTGEHTGGVYVKIHHIISDGWSQALICNRIADSYFRLLSGQKPELEEAPGYRLHVQEEQDYLNSRHYEKDRRYWKNVMEGGSEPSVLKDVRGAAVSPVGRRLSYRLPQHLNHAIYTYCMSKRVAPFAVFYTALATYFKRIGGGDRFTIGVPIFNRTNYKFRQSTGMFVSTLPFVGDVDVNLNFREFTDKLAENWLEMLRHQRFPFRDICAMAENSNQRLFQIAFSYQDSKLYESHDTSVAFSGRWHYSGYQAEQLCIHLSNLESVREYAVDYDYLTQFFTEKEISAFHNCLMNIIAEGLANSEKPLRELSMLDLSQREQVLYSFNRTSRYLHPGSAYDVFSATTAGHPERICLIHQGQRLSYRTLDQQAGTVSTAVARQNPGKQGLAAIMLPRNFSLFAAMVGVLRAGWAYLLIAEETPVLRAANILQQSGAGLVVGNSRSVEQLKAMNLSLPVLDMDSLPQQELSQPASAAPTDLAYVVYTSGSTGTPKGVEVCQKSLLNLADTMKSVYGSGAVLSMCNTGFDAFVLESAAALMDGRTIVLPTPEELESPRRLASLIRNFAVGTLITTPSRLQALLQECEFRHAMNRVECVICGGEVFPRELLALLSACSHARVYNQYGPSETTVAVSHKLLNCADLITVGKPMQNCRLYVLDQWRNPVPVGVYGELYIGGLCVARGYRNDPELTHQRFLPSPFESGERIYRTGDIACWTEEGEIILAGRSDQQLKLHGLRVEPQEVISCLSGYPGVEHVAVQVVEISQQPIIAAYYTSTSPIPDVDLLTYAASYLPQYMVPAYLCRLDEIPLTPNGKVDTARLPEPKLDGYGQNLPADAMTMQVLDVFGQDLQQDIGADEDYFLHGGSSLTAMRTLAELEERTGCTMRVSDLYACRTARRLAQCISRRMGLEEPEKAFHAIDKAPEQDFYPLSPIQRGIYFQCAMNRFSVLYNMPGAFRIAADVEPQRLEQAFRNLIGSETCLRTAFVMENGGIWATVRKSVSFRLEQLEGNTAEEVFHSFLRPFDLTNPPLLRAGLWKHENQVYLFIDTHHLISDGLTTPILLDRLDSYYRGENPALPGIDYLDYAYHLEKQGGASQDDLSYWKQYLNPAPDPLKLPADHGRSNTGRGAQYRCVMSRELSEQTEQFCRSSGISEYALFMAAYGLFLSAVTGRTEFSVGTPVSSRNRPELLEVCGPLLNVLPFKAIPRRDMKIKEYLQAVSEDITQILDHSSCSQEELFSALQLPRDPSSNPLYSVTLSLRPFEVSELSLGGSPMELVPLGSETNKAELGLEVSRDGGIYTLNFEYAADLFETDTIAFYGRCMAAILAGLMNPTAGTLAEIDPMDMEDRIAMFDRRDHVWKPFLNLPVHEIARQTAMLHAADTAVIFHEEKYSRERIEKRACQIANTLHAAGVEPKQRVGLSMKRTPDLFAGMLGILKTGCAYVPMPATLPEKRMCYMAELADIAVILSDEETLPELPERLRDKALIADKNAPEQFQTVPAGPDDLINVLFTSGSTGQPKGVMVRHGSASNLLSNMQEVLQGVTGPMLCVTTISFDIFMTESLLPLAMGRTIVLADEEEMLLPWKIAELVEENRAGFIQFTASRLSMCLGNDAFCRAARNLQYTIVGGEQVSPALVKKFKSCCDGRLVNHYGPTEATVYTTMIDLNTDEDVTIGRPMGNCRVYVMDSEGNRLLPTAQGELYLAGTCVAAGYLGRPDLTEKAFLPDPFVPGEMMYRSGDLGRLRTDGRIDCLGRCDKQVKINGQRLEIDEIVTVMLDSKLVSQAVVVPVSREDGLISLHAFCVRTDGSTGKWEDLAAYLRQYLPEYMVPGTFHMLTEMPYTAGGKADLVKLQKVAEQTPSDFTGTVSDEPHSGAVPPPASADTEHVPQEEKKQPSATAGQQKKFEENPSLPVLQMSGNSDAPVTEDQILAIWSQVLKGRKLEADRSFFEQGGTSLDTLNVLSLYFNAHLSMSIAQFYQNPTARDHVRLLNQGKSFTVESLTQTAATKKLKSVQEDPELPIARQPKSRPDQPEQMPRLSSDIQPERLSPPHSAQMPTLQAQQDFQNPESGREWMRRYVPGCLCTGRCAKVIFLTGATGFLGAHLLRALLQQGAEQIICLIRGDIQRLTDTLSWYFGAGWTAAAMKKIRVLSGDLCQPLLGLSRENYEQLALQTEAVYHAAADVRHFVRDEQKLMENNIGGTRAAIELALEAHATLHYMSTLSVSGEYFPDDPQRRAVFTERDFDMGQNWRDNVYVRSKMYSEAAVYDAVTERHLQARVYRLGRLVWRAEDGVFQKNPRDNMTALLCWGIAELGAFPGDLAQQLMDMTPVDLAAQMIVSLAGSSLTTVHVMNPNPVPTGTLLQNAVPNLRLVSGEEFDLMLGRRMEQNPGGVWPLLVEFVRMLRSCGDRITALNLMTQAALDAADRRFRFPDALSMGEGLSGVLEQMRLTMEE